MQIERLKPYKFCDPFITIQNIRGILKECGILTIENHFSVPQSNLYSCSVTVANEGLISFGIGTNGKGITPIYALASAYGEFMERLQNQWLFRFNDLAKYSSKYFFNENKQYSYFKNLLESKNLILDFIYAPDELLLSYEKLSREQKCIYQELIPYERSDLEKFINFSKSVELPWLPFYNFKCKSIKYLPIDLINLNARTNGLCAGNTKEEALIQGICEIFERYAIKEIFQKELSPPSIPTDIFQGTSVLEKLNFMEKELSIKYMIKDCSLGLNLPVIGLLLINQNTNKIFFNLGSDVSPITALERCLTEAYQGVSGQNNLRFKNIDFTKIMEFKNIEIDNIFRNATGCWPNSILYGEESYPFNYFEYPVTKSDGEDLKYLLNKIESLELDLYIRDVSYLGFPAFCIYIPKMSNIDYVYQQKAINCKSIINDKIINYFKVPYIFSIKQSSDEQLTYILRIISTLDAYGSFSIFPYNLNEDNKIDENLLSAMIFYKLKKYKESYEFLNIYIDNIEKEFSMDYFYYYCVRDYIYLKNEKKPILEIRNILENIYKQELLMEVMEDLNDEDNIFHYANFPNCFHCDNCKIVDDCKYIEIIRIFKTFQEIQSRNTIDQLDINNILNQ